MEIWPILTEITAETETVKDVWSLRVGEVFIARVAEVRHRELLLLLKGGGTMRASLLSDLNIKEGLPIMLQVKGIEKGKVELMLLSSGNVSDGVTEHMVDGHNIPRISENTPLIEEMLRNGLPATCKNIETVHRVVKLLSFLLENKELLPRDVPTPTDIDLADISIDELTGRLLRTHENGPSNKTLQYESLLLLLEEIDELTETDIIKLMKYGFKISLKNLALARNLMENKGLPDGPLKILYRGLGQNNEFPTKTSAEGRQYNRVFYEHVRAAEGKPDEKLLFRQINHTADGAKLMEEKNLPAIKPIDIKLLLSTIIGREKDTPRQRAAGELLMQRVSLLREALSGHDIYMLHFIFNGSFYGSIVRDASNKGQRNSLQTGSFEFEFETYAPHLGDITVHIKVEHRELLCTFYVDDYKTKVLIDKEKELLRKGLTGLGFKPKKVQSYIKPVKRQRKKDEYIDLRV